MAISVCMATFNGAKFIVEQVRSVLDQISAKDELIVSDDGSTDATLDLLPHDSRIRVVAGPRQGAYANFANALHKARGELIFLADQDDVWEPFKIARQSPVLTEAALCVSDAVVTDADGSVLQPSYLASGRFGPGLLRNFVRCGFLGCCMAFRRDLLDTAMPIPSGVPHDWWLGMVATITGRVTFLPEPLVRLRRHGSNLSRAAGVSDRPISARLAERMKLGMALARTITF